MMGTEANSEKVGIPEASSKGRNDSRQDPRRSGVWRSGHGLQTGLTHPGPSAGTGLCHDQGSPRAGPTAGSPSGATSALIQNLKLFFPPGLEPGWASGKEDRGAWGKTSGHPGTRTEALGFPPFPTLLLLLTRSWQTSRPACGLHLTS